MWATLVDKRVVDTIVHLEDTDGLIINNKIYTTTEHRFYTSNEEWVHAKDLNVDDKILKVDGSYEVVESIELDSEPHTVYNFTVEDTHNYFVEDLLAHNIKGEGNFGQF